MAIVLSSVPILGEPSTDMNAAESWSNYRSGVDVMLAAIAEAISFYSVDDGVLAKERISSFADHLFSTLSPRTQKAYRGSLKRWTKWIDTHGKAACPIDPESLDLFARHERDQGLAPKSVMAYIAFVRVFLRHCQLLTQSRAHALDGVQRYLSRLPVQRRERPLLPANFVERLAQNIDLSNARDVRDAAVLALLCETMARPAEILGCKTHGVWQIAPVRVNELTLHSDGSGRILLQRTTTKDGRDAVYVSPTAMVLVRAWLTLSGLRSGALFRTFRETHHLSPDAAPYRCDQLRYSLRRIAERFLPQGRQLGATSILRRHTANRMLEAGIHLDDVRLALRCQDTDSVVRLHERDRRGGGVSQVLLRYQQLRTVSGFRNQRAKGEEDSSQLDLFDNPAALPSSSGERQPIWKPRIRGRKKSHNRNGTARANSKS